MTSKTTQDFDCVEMKHRIQRRILDEIEQIGEQAYRQRAEARVMNDPTLSQLVQRARGSTHDNHAHE